MLAEKNSYISSAYQHFQVISQDEEKRMEYEARAKAIRDYNQGILEAEQRGIEKSIEAIILDNLEEDISKEKILVKLQKRFNLTEEQARQYYQRFACKEI